MKTAKNIVTKGLLIAVLAFMAMTAIDMAKNGTVFSTKVAQAKIKIPKNAKSNEAKAAKKINESKAYNKISSCKWKSGKLIKLDLSNRKQLSDLVVTCPKLTSLNLSGATSLKEFRMSDNYLKSLDLSGLTSLSKIIFDGRNHSDLESVDLTNCSSLQLENVKFWLSFSSYSTKFLYNGLTYQYYGNEKGWLEVKPNNG